MDFLRPSRIFKSSEPSGSESGLSVEKPPEKTGAQTEEDIFDDNAIDPVYQAKARFLNKKVQEIGMGRYQWVLFFVAGFGWLADEMWPFAAGLILTPVVTEFKFKGPFLFLGANIGLLVGAVFWGIGSDIWGRRFSFNVTLLITAIFATSAGAAPNVATICALAGMWMLGVGGNLPVDSAVFIEFLPASHQYLLTVLSIWWAIGGLIAGLIAWPLIGNLSCPVSSENSAPCLRSANKGWRYFLFTMGGLMFILWFLRFFVLPLYESPKYLMGRGRDAEAIEVLKKIAAYNRREGVVEGLTAEDLTNAGKIAQRGEKGEGEGEMDTSALGVIKRTVRTLLGGDHVRGLFETRKLAWNTSLLMLIWGLIGLAFPLYSAFITYYLATRGADFGDGSVYTAYRNSVIIAVIGVPGALFAGYMVEIPFLGRRGTLAISTVITGVFLFISTTARSSAALLGWNCAYNLTSNIMYGVLYALTPEMFPTKHRGTGNALVAASNRIFGIMSPIIALYADTTTSVPIFISGALFVVAGVLSLLLPFESRGRAPL